MSSNGSSKTRARVSSAVVGGSENSGRPGTGVTFGDDRFTVTGGGVWASLVGAAGMAG
jgi:hypothetical protein